MHIYASRTIPPGEEIMISYIGVTKDNTSVRTQSLLRWGIDCKCPSCLDHVFSDARRKYIWTERPQSRMVNWGYDSAPLKWSAFKVWKKCKEEGLQGSLELFGDCMKRSRDEYRIEDDKEKEQEWEAQYQKYFGGSIMKARNPTTEMWRKTDGTVRKIVELKKLFKERGLDKQKVEQIIGTFPREEDRNYLRKVRSVFENPQARKKAAEILSPKFVEGDKLLDPRVSNCF
jgi:hypothetical protein